MRTQPVRVAIDLETTGLHPEQDAVTEIGALKFAGDEVLETFESFVSPGIPVPYRVRRLTGITQQQLRGAPTMAELAPRLRAFLGDLPLVGHSVPFDAAFLRRAGLARRNPLVDTYELASALLPDLKSYALASVGNALGISSPTYHRALADAQLARDVFLALLARLEALDAHTVEVLGRLATPPDWTPGYFIRGQVREQRSSLAASSPFAGLTAGRSGTLGDQLAAKLGMDPAVLSLAISSDTLPVHTVPAVTTPDVDMGDPANIAVTRTVAECLEAGGALAVEVAHDQAGVEACLIPALRWAVARDRQVLVAVADAESAAQLRQNVLPRALAAASLKPEDVTVAEVAEHEGYLCLHRWYGAALTSRDGYLPRDLARGLAKLAVWANTTQTGARAEVSLGGQETEAWERTRSGSEFMDSSPTCAYRRDGYCFVARAQQAGREARLVLTTHAALAAQLAGNDSMLPDATRVIVLDAHQLEEALREVHCFQLERQEALDILGTLAVVEEGGKRAGLLHLAAQHLATGAASPEPQWFKQVERGRQAVDAYFAAARALVLEAQGGEGNGGSLGDSPEQRTLRLDSQARHLATWDDFARAWTTLDERLGATVKMLREVTQKQLSVRGVKANPASDGIVTDLLATARRLEHIRSCGAEPFAASSDGSLVHWLRVPYPTAQNGAAFGQRNGRGGVRFPAGRRGAERTTQASADATRTGESPAASVPAPRAAAKSEAEAPVFHTAPVRVGSLLAPLYAPDRSLVMAGPALAVSGDFAYLRGSLGLSESVRTLVPALDRAGQTLLCLPTDVPEPNAAQYQRHLDDALVALATALGGRLVALFPSHAALRSSAQGVRRALERHDILVLAQGQDGSARQLWQTFRSEPRVVLLGAGAFWEGADQSEHPPACVVVTRVPFPALGDPLLAARADTWSDPQNQFVVPHAALKLRQALGGLAWSHHQRNAVVLFDRRIQTRGYGPTVLGTLPRCTQYQDSIAQVAERVAEWVGEV